MDLLSREDLKRLAESHGQPCVSIFMPTYRAGSQVEQNAIRFKNLMRQAEGNLITGGLRALQAQELLKPAQTLLGQTPFWHNQADGLALFVSPLMFVHYRLPLGFEELVVTTNRFHLKPLLQLLNGDGTFYPLAFSKKQVRLFQGTKFNLSELGLTVGTTRHYEFCRVSFRTGNSLQIFVRMVTVWPPSGLVKVHEKEHSRSHQFSRSLLKNVSMRCCFPWFRSFSVPLAYGESR